MTTSLQVSKRPKYVFYPLPNTNEQPKDTLKMFCDLGRATKRGIKKCFKCGTYNGTRGIMCKNKQCDAVFKSCGDKQTANLDAIKLISGTSRQVFSVRVKDKGPDCRGFVQLPLMQGTDEENEKNVALSEVALCFVDSCQRLFDDSILKCHETEKNKVTPVCIHIKSALKSVNVATPIETKNPILNSLNLEEDVKEKLWLLSNEIEGALVQRVSQTVMAVKCQVTSKHPLGYLHFTFFGMKGKETYDKFYCSCMDFKSCNFNQKCIHFYACAWAFASDFKTSQEFISFLDLILCIGNDAYQASTVKQNTSSKRYVSLGGNKIRKIRSCKVLPVNVAGKKLLRPKSASRKCSHRQNSLSFFDWFTFVTEKINQRLCQKRDSVENVTFYIPSGFFELLEDRLRIVGRKLKYSCIKNTDEGVSYLIYSIQFIEELFNTPKVSLQVVNVFFQNSVGELFPELSETQSEAYESFVAYLKVGVIKHVDACVPFCIKWNPSVFPGSKFGKLELEFHVGWIQAAQFNSC